MFVNVVGVVLGTKLLFVVSQRIVPLCCAKPEMCYALLQCYVTSVGVLTGFCGFQDSVGLLNKIYGRRNQSCIKFLVIAFVLYCVQNYFYTTVFDIPFSNTFVDLGLKMKNTVC